MYQRTKIVTAAANPPVTLTEAKAHLRVDFTNDDTLITTLINVAAEYAENRLGRALITQTWDLYLDEFPSKTIIEIPFSPLQSITFVKYYDKDNVLQTWATSNYDVDTISEPARVIQSNTGNSFPSTYNRPNAVNVRFIAGYGATSVNVPEIIRAGIKLLISHFYENREAILVSGSVSDIPIPKAIENLFNLQTINRTF